MFRNRRNNSGCQPSARSSPPNAESRDLTASPEVLHRACWYSRRTDSIPEEVVVHATIEDGHLLFCGHPMWFPVVGYQLDVRNCVHCEYFKPVRPTWE
jgi:hypothetical protein